MLYCNKINIIIIIIVILMYSMTIRVNDANNTNTILFEFIINY